MEPLDSERGSPFRPRRPAPHHPPYSVGPPVLPVPSMDIEDSTACWKRDRQAMAVAGSPRKWWWVPGDRREQRSTHWVPITLITSPISPLESRLSRNQAHFP